jgi:VWFA-related protein
MRSLCPAVLIVLAVFFGLAAIHFPASLLGQGVPPVQQPGPPGTYRVRVRLVPVDVIVTDSRGRPVVGLKQEDFRVLENGKPQEIRHFSVQTFDAAAPMPEQASVLRAIPAAELSSQASRVFLILMGRGHYQIPFKTVDVLIQFVRRSLLPQDRVALFAYNRATDFTTDHEKIAQVLEAYKGAHESIESRLQNFSAGLASIFGNKEFPKTIQPDIDKIFESVQGLGSRQVPPGRLTAEGKVYQEWQKATGMVLGSLEGTPTTELDSLESGASMLWLPFDEFAVRSRSTMSDVNNIFTCIEYLRYVEGEKHLLFFSEHGLTFPFGNTEYDQGIAAVANDARVAIDTFQTGGLPAATNWAQTFSILSMKNVSQLTGGSSSAYENMVDALSRVNESSRVEYLLGYYPDNEKWDGGFRKVSVKVNRPGVKVLFRHGYYAREQLQAYDPVEFLAWSRINSAGVQGTRKVEYIDIPLDIRATKVKDTNSQYQNKLDLKMDAKRISFKIVNNLHVAHLRTAVFYADADGKYLGSEYKNMDLQFTEDTYQTALQAGIPFSMIIPRKSPTEFVVVVVYDISGDRLGSRWVIAR